MGHFCKESSGRVDFHANRRFIARGWSLVATGLLLFTAFELSGCGGAAASGNGGPPTSAPAVGLSASTLSFGNVAVGSTSQGLGVTLTNTGTAGLQISGVAISGDYQETNSCPATLTAGSNCSLTVSFAPTAAGTRTGTLTISDNVAGSPQQVSLTGVGTTLHNVNLTWDASTSVVVGYNVYRGSQSGGPYTPVNSVLIPSTSYTDVVQGGQTYFYVVTAVDADSIESVPSNEGVAVAPD